MRFTTKNRPFPIVRKYDSKLGWLANSIAHLSIVLVNKIGQVQLIGADFVVQFLKALDASDPILDLGGGECCEEPSEDTGPEGWMNNVKSVQVSSIAEGRKMVGCESHTLFQMQLVLIVR